VCIIWTERNKRVHEDRFIRAQEIGRRVIKKRYKDFQSHKIQGKWSTDGRKITTSLDTKSTRAEHEGTDIEDI